MIPTRPTRPSPVDGYSIRTTDDGSDTVVIDRVELDVIDRVEPDVIDRVKLDGVGEVAFHSGCGAVAESRHVYLQNSGVLSSIEDGVAVRLLEVGVGVGLNFLLTADAVRCRTEDELNIGDHDAPPRLSYVGLDSNWLNASVINDLNHGQFLRNEDLRVAMIEVYIGFDSSSTQTHRSFDSACGNVSATFYDQSFFDWCDVHAAVVDPFDAIYFDPFDPATNPELWTTATFERLRDLTRPGGCLTTYCVKVSVRRAMQSAGWDVRRVPGPPGGKREVCVATRT